MNSVLMQEEVFEALPRRRLMHCSNDRHLELVAILVTKSPHGTSCGVWVVPGRMIESSVHASSQCPGSLAEIATGLPNVGEARVTDGADLVEARIGRNTGPVFGRRRIEWNPERPAETTPVRGDRILLVITQWEYRGQLRPSLVVTTRRIYRSPSPRDTPNAKITQGQGA